MSDHIGDATEMVGDTPRTDAAEYESIDEPVVKLGSVDAAFARQLERELNAANQRIKRLEEAGKNLRECAGWVGYPLGWSPLYILRAKVAIEVWDKEAKP